MKKILTGLLIVTLAVSAGAVTTSAAESVYGRHYADYNKDGVCDYCVDGSSKCKSQIKYRNSKNCRNSSNSRHHSSSHKGHHRNR